jgi:hypothetical protein
MLTLAEPEPVRTAIELRGGVAKVSDLVRANDKDPRGCLVEGGAGTGKTFAMQAVMHMDCLENPGARWVMARKTRESMTTTVLEEPWESDVIKDSLIAGTVRIEGGTHRKAYRYSNGSSVYPTGIDDVSKVMSGGFRGICIHEVTGAQGAGAEGISERQYQYLLTRLGRKARGFMLLDCNPAAADHWANRWAHEGRLRRFLSRHQHNPLYATAHDLEDGRTRYEWTELGREYLQNLMQLVGPQRARLLDHKWSTAAGLVFPEWDPEVHMVTRARAEEITNWDFAWMSQDWGWNAPGCLQLWAATTDGIIYRLWEVMYRYQKASWWADRVVELARWAEEHLHVGIRSIECGHEKEESVGDYNDWLRKAGFAAVARQINPQHKTRSKTGGSTKLDTVRYWMNLANTGNPGMYLVEDAAICGIDPTMREAGMPLTTPAQLGSYVLAEDVDGKPIPETPDPGCRDDGVDALIYAVDYAHRVLKPGVVPKPIKPKRDAKSWEARQEAEDELERDQARVAKRAQTRSAQSSKSRARARVWSPSAP